MSDIIRLLPDSVANQIAAGEVIQRPASVIKELVENAIDAGATNIKIILKDAGRTLIQVVDNGKGMSTTDARLAFERHATSKIKEAADLFALHTMGFRGEALASIAAIAQIDMRTMRKEDSIGTRIIINGSKVESQEPEACSPGTNMMVKNLFFNVPARRKFLKKDSVELSNIVHEFERLALVNIGVEFSLIHNETTLHQLLPGTLKQRIVALFGKALDHQLIPIETATSLAKISGFVGLPENARRRGALQYFFVNGRNMRHPYFHKAVMQCYDQLIPVDEQPNYFINFEVDPETIDVNIHPTKNEIKFENEQPIWQILTAAIKESLGKFNAVPSIDFDAEDVPEIPAFQPNVNAPHDLELDTSYNPFDTHKSKTTSPSSSPIPSRMNNITWQSKVSSTTQNWEKLYEDFNNNKTSNDLDLLGSRINDDQLFSQDSATEVNTFAGINAIQLKCRYILTPSREGVSVIDQHRAHIRVLFDSYLNMAINGEFTTQRLIFPDMIQLSTSQTIILESINEQLSNLGFDISYLGDNSWSVNGLPSVLNNANPGDIISKMIETVESSGENIETELLSNIALSMARSAAIKPGQALSNEEIEKLLGSLFRLSTPNFTPDGKTVIATISLTDISKLF
ncbi:MAG: DNA mismatch repair endonuclease MutL [Muribaculaceae bacterium]|nr:DNA mismatch repair endonuclease MutL [Muribaculaceae bacterium]